MRGTFAVAVIAALMFSAYVYADGANQGANPASNQGLNAGGNLGSVDPAPPPPVLSPMQQILQLSGSPLTVIRTSEGVVFQWQVVRPPDEVVQALCLNFKEIVSQPLQLQFIDASPSQNPYPCQ